MKWNFLRSKKFGVVYGLSLFAFTSYGLLDTFFIPMLLGLLPWLHCAASKEQGEAFHIPDAAATNLQAAGIGTLTIGALFQGVLEIYGTTSTFTDWYYVIGICLIFGAYFLANNKNDII